MKTQLSRKTGLVESRIVSKKRVVDHGEVLTGEREVNAMLELVKQETERIESRFLEPACGTGNFLAPVLERKLQAVEARYRRSQVDYERYAVLAVSSLYGIDLLSDNVEECRERLLTIFRDRYTQLYRKKVKPACLRSARFILDRNIACGDALAMVTADNPPKPIELPEWSFVSGSKIKRRDFEFTELVSPQNGFMKNPLVSDLGQVVYLPEPKQTREYPPMHFLELGDADND